ncbi:hypothetical protein JCM19233_6916 [Vibrio astriarenae]|nr:hypothetical protein JCM19233_6916 [Vibrio sp. C7]
MVGTGALWVFGTGKNCHFATIGNMGFETPLTKKEHDSLY